MQLEALAPAASVRHGIHQQETTDQPKHHGRLCAQAWRRTAQSVEALALSLQREVPDTAATMRLSGLELADAIGEVTLLGAGPDRGKWSAARLDRMHIMSCRYTQRRL